MAIQRYYYSEDESLPDVYQYNELPDKAATQIQYILDKYFQQDFPSTQSNRVFIEIHQILKEELAVRELYKGSNSGNWVPAWIFTNYFQSEQDIKIRLTMIQIALLAIQKLEKDFPNRTNSYYKDFYDLPEVVKDVNARLRQYAVGFQYVDGRILRVDDDIQHIETVQKVLFRLEGTEFSNVKKDFLDAHEHYKNNLLEECLVDCGKAFESTMKTICKLKNWPVSDKATSAVLIKALIEHDFFPAFQQGQLTALRTLLETAIPTPRNRLAAHGSSSPTIINPALASYMLFTTGATIRLMVELYYD